LAGVHRFTFAPLKHWYPNGPHSNKNLGKKIKSENKNTNNNVKNVIKENKNNIPVQKRSMEPEDEDVTTGLRRSARLRKM
jgi:hypothetical protein